MVVPMAVVKETPEAPEDLVVVDQTVLPVEKELLAKEMMVVTLSLIEVAVAVAVKVVPETKALLEQERVMVLEAPVVLLDQVIIVEQQ
jgi:hypothetical protein